MKQRPYRGDGCLQERISDELCRRRAEDRDVRSKDEMRRQRAQNLAGTAINAMTDHSASRIDQSARKHDLLDGPREFRSSRRDR
ncbi:hypothetical protein H8B02_10575 [Bradyrhizobium sp. Pear77]|uniref:hypothetical protein n=1 Tax=Bradyrhizobium altum TaxID=1571202 RepID=UPI001E4D71A8|nr:hypothetical protein [Bradyrhizobium altum]MCC8953883.1 hypothetical protein [Bradyrhizobium altum]